MPRDSLVVHLDQLTAHETGLTQPEHPLKAVYEGFRWRGEFFTQERMRLQLGEFLGGVGSRLGLNPDNVLLTMNRNLGLAEAWYETVFPRAEMKVHNVEHITSTSAVAMKIFLGLLESMSYQSNGSGIFENSQALDRVVATASAVFAGHEFDDWWGEETLKGRGQDFDFPGMHAKLRADLEAQGVSYSDFNRLVKLDDFVTDLPEMLTALETSGIEDFLLMVPTDQRMLIAEAIGIAINAADFAQICNDGYSEQAKAVGEDGAEHVSLRGVMALAREFELYRPKALAGAGWARDDDPLQVDLAKTRWTRWFYDNKAHPRIMRGLQALWIFDSEEARRLWERMDWLEQQFAD